MTDSVKPKYVYALHANDGVYRYIGRTNAPTIRLWGHLSGARRGGTGIKNAWIREVGEENVQLVILEEFIETPERTAADVEKEYILKYSDNGMLLNTAKSTNGAGSIVPKKTKRYLLGHHTSFHFDWPRDGCKWCEVDK